MRTLILLAILAIPVLKLSAQSNYRPSSEIEQLYEEAVDITDFPEDDCERSYMMGMQDAKDYFGQGLWGLVGVSSCLIGVCGPAWAGYLGVRSQLPTPTIPEGVNEACYLHGFDMSIVEMRSRNVAIGVTSGVVAASIVYIGILIASSSCGI